MQDEGQALSPGSVAPLTKPNAQATQGGMAAGLLHAGPPAKWPIPDAAAADIPSAEVSCTAPGPTIPVFWLPLLPALALRLSVHSQFLIAVLLAVSGTHITCLGYHVHCGWSNEVLAAPVLLFIVIGIELVSPCQ